MKKHILIVGVLFLICSGSDAMLDDSSFVPEEENKYRGSLKSIMLNEEEVRARIDQAIRHFVDAEFEKILSTLQPIFHKDMSLVYIPSNYDGIAHDLYAQALWASDKKRDSTLWFFKAADHGNDDALTSIGLTSETALELFQNGKKEAAFERYTRDLETFLAE